jgi:hypothetical protein
MMTWLDLPLGVLIIAWVGRRCRLFPPMVTVKPRAVIRQYLADVELLLAAMPVRSTRLGEWCKRRLQGFRERLQLQDAFFRELGVIEMGEFREKKE